MSLVLRSKLFFVLASRGFRSELEVRKWWHCVVLIIITEASTAHITLDNTWRDNSGQLGQQLVTQPGQPHPPSVSQKIR